MGPESLPVHPLQREHVLAAPAEARRLDGVRPRPTIPLLRHRPDFYSVGNGFIVSRHKHQRSRRVEGDP